MLRVCASSGEGDEGRFRLSKTLTLPIPSLIQPPSQSRAKRRILEEHARNNADDDDDIPSGGPVARILLSCEAMAEAMTQEDSFSAAEGLPATPIFAASAAAPGSMGPPQPTAAQLLLQQQLQLVPNLPAGLALKRHQVSGVAWAHRLYGCMMNGILADDMGLGKTIQAICIMKMVLSEFQDAGPHLIVVPTSTIYNKQILCLFFLS